MNDLLRWAQRNNITQAAMSELRQILDGVTQQTRTGITHGSEAAMQNRVRLQASQRGWLLFRNNVGAGTLQNGRFMRWGVANDSAAMNQHIKSGDLIGVKPVVIMPDMVGLTIGQFVSREIKKPNWHYTGNEHERAQRRWVDLLASYGADAAFSTGEL